MRSKLMTGAQAIAYVNGAPFGRVANVNLVPRSPHETLHTLDVLEPVELVHLPVTVAGEITMYRMVSDGGAEVSGMASDWGSLTRARYWSLLIVNRAVDKVVLKVEGCATEGQTWGFGRGYVMGKIAFSAMRLAR